MKAATVNSFILLILCSISIHAAREGGDGFAPLTCAVGIISIHAAREGGDGINPEDRTTSMTFQSTPPVKAATKPDYFVVVVQPISIHAAREGGDRNGECNVYTVGISIHAAREGGDRMLKLRMEQGKISIHAAREGGDASCQ